MTLSQLGDPRYILLRTFRRTGVAVDTPVWVAAESGRLYVLTSLVTGKAKRIRNNPEVEVCQCDMRGRPRGEWVPARATLAASPEAVTAGRARISRKYGWQYKLMHVRRGVRPYETVIEIADRS